MCFLLIVTNQPENYKDYLEGMSEKDYRLFTKSEYSDVLKYLCAFTFHAIIIDNPNLDLKTKCYILTRLRYPKND